MTTKISNIPLLSDSSILSIGIEQVDPGDSDIKSEINNYFITKKMYYNFIQNYKPKQKFNTTIDTINTNYPLKFYESENKLILEIIDPNSHNVVYKKQIILERGLNLENEVYNLRKVINSNQYSFDKTILYNKFNKIKEAEHLLEINYLNKEISEDKYKLKLEEINKQKQDITDKYNIFAEQYNNIISRFDTILNKIKNN